ncbi:iron-sulfur cluster assembly 2 homolog, mitochondrial-like isoform X2 [Tigriopus californicus]|uniref:iron-sulfur cluster assembly 2 homolog, mitochondrial-like isoform X2 n=1 Tax=Tigriopus californicus TaxID=6832 RepID=UPI0027DA42BE|nr:iron-sulfur cluster assembly 2 homolog, mitochondrial-like isoform X2 [Tigriopus californicus]
MLNLSRVLLSRGRAVAIPLPQLAPTSTDLGIRFRPASSASPQASAPPSLRLSDSCVQRLQQLRQNEPETMLRIIVEGGGCSGFQYRFDLSDHPEVTEEDRVIERDGAAVVIDETSLEFLQGSTIDFHRELIRAGFRIIDNPKAEGGCSCGVSFSVKLD